jgi:hypothetical protein
MTALRVFWTFQLGVLPLLIFVENLQDLEPQEIIFILDWIAERIS